MVIGGLNEVRGENILEVAQTEGGGSKGKPSKVKGGKINIKWNTNQHGKVIQISPDGKTIHTRNNKKKFNFFLIFFNIFLFLIF